MESAASQAVGGATWTVVSDGAPIASVASYRDAEGVVVTTQFFGSADEAERVKPYRFPDAGAADSFVRDLVASFSYLGCHVSQA